MRTGEIVVRVVPQTSPSRVLMAWDPEAYILSVRFSQTVARMQTSTPAQSRIDAAVGITEDEYLVQADGVTLILDHTRTLTALEVRSNPSTWEKSLLPSISGLPAASIQLSADFDRNGIASVSTTPFMKVDSIQPRLSIGLGEFGAISSRYLCGDKVEAGITSTFELVEISLSLQDIWSDLFASQALRDP